MALTLILAARWRIIDHIMGGPDKSYVLHRWLGFLALFGAMAHWSLASSVGRGVLPILSESGENSGIIAVAGLLILTAAALVRVIPYHLWKASHMLMGPIFVLAAYHTFFVASPLSAGTTPWSLMAAVTMIGLIAWTRTLHRKLSPSRLMAVETVDYFEGGVDVVLKSEAALSTFQPGQYATLAGNYARAEEHPFTIAGGDGACRRFVIRAAGDWTDTFVRSVKPGDTFHVSSGVGRFLPQIGKRRRAQVWVAGGVGITPFLAALEQMEPDDAASITLVFCVKSVRSAGAMSDVERHAARLPQVNLLVFNEELGGRLTAFDFDSILNAASHVSEAYVCGPESLKSLVAESWENAGMKGKVHSERFDFRGAYGINDLVYIGQPVLKSAVEIVQKVRVSQYAPAGS